MSTHRSDQQATCTPYRRRASSFYRTLVVGAVALSGLFVFFSLYQYWTADPEDRQPIGRPQLPVMPTPPEPTDADSQGIKVPVKHGPDVHIRESEKMRLTLYAPEGTQARFELQVKQWTPIGGETDEFALEEPDIRLRTNSGNAVRVTAASGLLEAQMHGSDIKPSRGHLSGDVVIKIDRLTEKEREALPEPQRSTLEPADLVVIKLDRIDFDLTYSKVAIPGPFTMTARDVHLEGEDLELRFDKSGSRVDECRIDHGGVLELREATEELNLSIPSLDAREGKQSTLVEWIRATLQAGLEAQHAAETASQASEVETVPPKPEAALEIEDVDIPLFQPDSATKKKRERPPVRYQAMFQENVEAAHHVGGAVESRLQADALEILRDFTERDRDRVKESAGAKAPEPAEASASADEPNDDRIIVRWSKRLIVRALYDDTEASLDGASARVVATGKPVRISTPEGQATCRRVKFEPGSSQVWLQGTQEDPVVVQSADQGTMTGTELYSNRTTDQKMYIRVAGPGTLIRDDKPTTDAASDERTAKAPTDSALSFSKQLEINGRFVTRSRWGLTSGYSEREERVIDEAIFTGGVDMKEDNTAIDADKLRILFDEGSRQSGGQQAIKQMIGEGNVKMTQGTNRLSCDNIDINLGLDGKGKLVPHTATAAGHVLAVQGSRTIQAEDRLIVEFQTVDRPLPPFNVLEAHEAAVAKGLDVSKIDWEARRREHRAKRTTEIGVRHLHAIGTVEVLDPTQSLELYAGELKCDVAGDEQIERAEVTGAIHRPASVRLESLTVTGQTIKLNVPDQWAEVPGPGRMTFRSQKDLDGRKLEQPIPIAVTWNDWMKYHGRENKSIFQGKVHATSQSTTTFDCDRLLAEFTDVAPKTGDDQGEQDWWIFSDLATWAADRSGTSSRNGLAGKGFSKELTQILATGSAKAQTSEFEDGTDKLKSRATIAGPSILVILLDNVSKMSIEGKGSLLMEDYQRPTEAPTTTVDREDGLFGLAQDEGQSVTLIEWDELMSYDFSIDQTLFRGVTLTYLSGEQLAASLSDSGRRAPPPGPLTGRHTKLTCEQLSVAFMPWRERGRQDRPRRFGRLSAARLRQFKARGSVVLLDPGHLSLAADLVEYEKDRDLLVVHGTDREKAHIIVEHENSLPQDFKATCFFYNTKTKRVEVQGASVKGR